MVPFDIYSYCRRVRSSQTLHLQIQLFGAFAPATTSTDFLSKFLRFATSVILRGHRHGSALVSHIRSTSNQPDLRLDFPFQYWVNREWPAFLVAPPLIRFLYIGLSLCYQFPPPVCYLPASVKLLDLPQEQAISGLSQHNHRCAASAYSENPVDE